VKPLCCLHRPPPSIGKQGSFRVAKGWRSPLAKAMDPDPEYEWLHEVADKAAPGVRQAFLDAIEKIKGSIKEKELTEALKSGNIREVLRVLNLDPAVNDTLAAALGPMIEDTFIEAGRESVPNTIVPVAGAGGAVGSAVMRFDVSNPHTADVLRQYNFGLIRQISDDTRAAIQRVVEDAFAYGGHPYEQARIIRSSIGLTDTQQAAVENFRAMLESGDRQALTRTLRDRRFDRTLDAALGEDAEKELTPEQITRMVGRYRERMIAARAENIARTTTIDVSNTANQAAWHQAAERGLLNRNLVRQGWLVTPDDRLCAYCAAVPLLNLDGVPLGGMFETPLGQVRGPTLHPQCRCIVYLMPGSF
jgi:hypothetical protein